MWLETEGIANDQYQVIITDISGRIVKVINNYSFNNESKTQLFIEYPGVYTIQLKGLENQYHKNIIVF